MTIVVVFILCLSIAIFAFLKQAKFGKLPTGLRLVRIKQSKNYSNGSFQNINPTPQFAEGVSYFTIIKKILFSSNKNKTPFAKIPSIKTNLFELDKNSNTLIWFGHSSYLLQTNGIRFLIDPVLSGSASPIPYNIKAFNGADIYKPADIPNIDYLIITHDHWDHLDYKTVCLLKDKIGSVICPLGVGEHFEYWGFNADDIIELDWWEKVELKNNLILHATPARHFSGRGFKRNQSLWSSYVLESADKKIFLGGDSAYDTHLKTLGDKFGGFDLAILENGQYNELWPYIHMMPNLIHQAAIDLKAKKILPVHSSKFALSNHDWQEPLNLCVENNKNYNLNIITPMIGEKVLLDEDFKTENFWWRNL